MDARGVFARRSAKPAAEELVVIEPEAGLRILRYRVGVPTSSSKKTMRRAIECLGIEAQEIFTSSRLLVVYITNTIFTNETPANLHLLN